MPITDKFITPAKLGDAWGINMFLTGSPGAGKTHLFGTGADLGWNILICDIEGGMRTLLDRDEGITVVPVTKWSEVEETLVFLEKAQHGFNLVAIDLVSEAYKLLLEQVTREGHATKSGQPTQEGYGIANTRFIKVIRDYRTLAREQGLHVVFTSHSNETKDEATGAILVRPNLTPGTLMSVVGAVDVVGYLEVKNKRKRLLHLVGSDRIIAKVRVPVSWGEVPETVEDPTLSKLFTILGGGTIGKS